jgi:hypothetical protein
MLMNVKPLFYHLEMGFWNTVIPLMQNSSIVRTLIPWFYRLTIKILSIKSILVVLVCIFSGVSVGFLIGLLSQIL